MDNLYFLTANGMPTSEIKRLLHEGITMEEIVAYARRRMASGLPLADPEEAVKEDMPTFFDEKGRFLHNELGDYLIDHYGCCKIGGTVHIYDSGVYRSGEEAVSRAIVGLMPRLKDSQRREVYRYVRDSPNTPKRELSPPNLIPFKSCVYDLNTGEFLDYSRELVFLNRFPWDYDPQAPETATVTHTLNAIAGNDPEVVNLLLETFGNCFYLLNSFRGAVMLYGPTGSNGKSTLLNMLLQLVGKENASHLSLQDTAEKFRLVEVCGKAVNIGDDISDAYLPDSSLFKKLVTGEDVIGEKKGQDPISFRSYAKLFFSMNCLPPVSDKSRAFFSRILLIPLNADFSSPQKRDPGLKDKKWSQEEMVYLLRLSMEGLKRLINRGDFMRPLCVQRAMDEYEIENNPVLGFLLDYGNVAGEPIKKVHDDYKTWCLDNGHRYIARYKFTREVCYQAGVQSRVSRHPYFGGGPGRCFVEQP